MQRFILTENIARFRLRLTQDIDESLRRTVVGLLAAAERDLVLLDSNESGAARGVAGDPIAQYAPLVREFLREVEDSPRNYLLLDPGPGLRIVGLNQSYARSTMIQRATVVGKRLFEVLPDNPELPSADGVRNLYKSLCLAAQTGRPHEMPIQRYDVRCEEGHYVERYWRPTNTPTFAPDGTLAYLLHHVEDVTREMVPG